MESNKEKAIAGLTSGLIDLNQTVTWKAKHFGIWFLLTSKITEFCENEYFVDEMTKGPFKSLYHKHSFNFKDDCTEMKDEFNFVSPMGVLGWLANTLFLKNYLKNLLEHRNQTIKKMAETGVWKNMLLINTA